MFIKETLKEKARKILEEKINNLEYISYQELNYILSLDEIDTNTYLELKVDFFKALAKIAAINSNYDELFDNILYPFVFFNKSYEVLNTNEAFTKNHGVGITSVVNKNFTTFLASESKKDFITKFEEGSLKEIKHITLNKANGTKTKYNCKIIKIANDISYNFLLILTDLQPKYNFMNHSLIGNQTLLEIISLNLPEVIFLRKNDQKNSILFLNHNIERLTGYRKIDFMNGNKSLIDIYYNEDYEAIFEKQKEIETEKSQYTLSYRIIDSAGETKWVEEHGFPIFDPTGEKLLYVTGLIIDQTESRQNESDYINAKKQLQELTAHIEKVREEEKKQIALQVHDELGQSLTAIKFDVSRIEKEINYKSEKIVKLIQDLYGSIDNTIDTVRRISSELRPAVLDHLGLTHAIEWQAEQFEERTAIKTILDLETYDVKINEQKSIAIYRILQETLTNIARHSKANIVKISLQIIGKDLELLITDNGVGITESSLKNPKSYGILGIKERALSIGANVKIQGFDNIGTSVKVTLPIRDKQE